MKRKLLIREEIQPHDSEKTYYIVKKEFIFVGHYTLHYELYVTITIVHAVIDYKSASKTRQRRRLLTSIIKSAGSINST